MSELGNNAGARNFGKKGHFLVLERILVDTLGCFTFTNLCCLSA